MEREKRPNKKLQYERELRGWSQAYVAEQIGTFEKTVSRWECGEQAPGPHFRKRLCDLFSKNAVELGFINQEVNSSFSYPTDDTLRDTNKDEPDKTIDQVIFYLRLLALGAITMASFDPQRRQALLRLLTSASIFTAVPQIFTDPEPWERICTSTGQTSAVDTVTLDHLEALVSSCWKLSNTGQLQVAERVLSSFLPFLLQLAPHCSKASGLAAQSLRLQSILVAHQMGLTEKVTLCQQAVIYARRANDHEILVVALIELVVAFRYIQLYEDALRTSQEVLHYSHQISPLLQARAYIIAAETLSRCKRTKEADLYIQLAYETFPDHLEYDPLVHSNPNILMMGLYEGLTYLNLGDGKKALATFEGKLFGSRLTAYQSLHTLPERIRLEITNYQGQAAILSNDLEGYARCLEEGITGAVSLKSQKRFNEVFTTFQQDVPLAWKNEQSIKEIAERYQLTV